MNHITPAEFFGMSLSIIDHGGRRWLTAEQVGLALGFAPDNARKGILKLYERHQDRFDAEDSTVVNLTTVEGGITKQRDFRIFSATGCVTLGWLAQTRKAKAFQQWAKKNLAAHLESRPALTADEIPAITRKYAAERDAARAALLKARPD
jgi:prophage antirepressor-like protein